MGKYEKKNHPSGGKYQRHRERRKTGGMLKMLLVIAAVLAVVILVFDRGENPEQETQPVQMEQPEVQQTEPVQMSGEATSEPVQEQTQESGETEETQETEAAEETRETEAPWFAYLIDRINGQEQTEPEPAQQTEEPSQPEQMSTKSRRMTYMEMSRGDLVLVNEEFDFPPAMADVTTLHDKASSVYHAEDITLCVQDHVVEPLNAWLEAFHAETDNREVMVSKAHQAQEEAHLDFHIGLTVELDTYHAATTLDDDEVYEKLLESAWEYGFVQRWPEEKAELTGVSDQKWSFRYVGIPHSVVMQEEGLCLEEYLEFIRDYTLEEGPLEVEHQGVEYEIYFCQGLEITVPANRKFTISGNNMDGFLVTVEVNA